MFYIKKMMPFDLKDVMKISSEQFGEKGWSKTLFLDDLNKEFKFAYVLKTEKSKNQNQEKTVENQKQGEITEKQIQAERQAENGKIQEQEANEKSQKQETQNQEKGEIVAFIVFLQTEGESGLEFNITNLAVQEKYKRLGNATFLINFVKQFSKQQKVKKIWLEVNENNLPAINLYKKLGFRIDYIRKNYYSNGENAFIMSLELAE